MTATVLTLGTANRVLPVKPARLTIASVRAELGKLGVKIKKNEDGEFRVILAGETEKSAYYTDDLKDALDTGKAMADWQEKKAAKAKAVVAAIAAPAKPEPVAYRLGSSPMVYAPGIVNWVRSGYWNKPDRQTLLRVLRDTWNLPPEVAAAIATTKEGTIDGETFVFEYRG
jgi:hypothetical protein